MTTAFPQSVATLIPEERVEGNDEVQPMALIVPMYHWVSAAFFANFINLTKVNDCVIQCTKGVYTPQAMRLSMKNLLAIPGWQRVLVIEADMLPPQDAIIKHSLHTDPIVGSLYFQHSEPYQANVMLMHPQLENYAHLKPIGIKTMLDKPALYKVDIVGLGCTSIRRDVIETWPAHIPMFRNEWEAKSADDPFSQGEVSHDVYFCKEAAKLGWDIYLDSSIKCGHLTEGAVSQRDYLRSNPVEPAVSRLVLPKQGRVRVHR